MSPQVRPARRAPPRPGRRGAPRVARRGSARDARRMLQYSSSPLGSYALYYLPARPSRSNVHSPWAPTTSDASLAPVRFETHPDRYRHWRLELPAEYGGAVARLVMDVQERRAGCARATRSSSTRTISASTSSSPTRIQRIRFEHPRGEGARLHERQGPHLLLGREHLHARQLARHALQGQLLQVHERDAPLPRGDERRERASPSLAALAGTASGGGYELAIACDEIVLADDGSSAVSLPEAPLLGVLPGTGGLTRLVDKRKVRRDLADAFSHLAEGVRGKRAVEWGLVDEAPPQAKFDEAVKRRARRAWSRAASARPVRAGEARRRSAPSRRYVHGRTLDDGGAHGDAHGARARRARSRRRPTSSRRRATDAWASAPSASSTTRCSICASTGPLIGVVALEDRAAIRSAVLAVDAMLAKHKDDGLVREVTLLMRRVLKRLDITAKSLLRAGRAGLAASPARSSSSRSRPTASTCSTIRTAVEPCSSRR